MSVEQDIVGGCLFQTRGGSLFGMYMIKGVSQLAFGELICTSVCLYLGGWLLKLDTKLSNRTMSQCVLQEIMKYAKTTWDGVYETTGLLNQSVDDIVQLFGDVFDDFEFLPVGGLCDTKFMCNSPHHMSLSVMLRNLPDNTACIVTSCGHSTLVLHIDHIFAWFDPLPSLWVVFDHRDEFLEFFDSKVNGDPFDATIMRQLPKPRQNLATQKQRDRCNPEQPGGDGNFRAQTIAGAPEANPCSQWQRAISTQPYRKISRESAKAIQRTCGTQSALKSTRHNNRGIGACKQVRFL